MFINRNTYTIIQKYVCWSFLIGKWCVGFCVNTNNISPRYIAIFFSNLVYRMCLWRIKSIFDCFCAKEAFVKTCRYALISYGLLHMLGTKVRRCTTHWVNNILSKASTMQTLYTVNTWTGNSWWTCTEGCKLLDNERHALIRAWTWVYLFLTNSMFSILITL